MQNTVGVKQVQKLQIISNCPEVRPDIYDVGYNIVWIIRYDDRMRPAYDIENVSKWHVMNEKQFLKFSTPEKHIYCYKKRRHTTKMFWNSTLNHLSSISFSQPLTLPHSIPFTLVISRNTKTKRNEICWLWAIMNANFHFGNPHLYSSIPSSISDSTLSSVISTLNETTTIANERRQL